MDGFVVAPGEVIREYISERGLKQKNVAQAIGISEKHLSNILNGKVRLSEAVAIKLEKVMPDVPAAFWLQYETRYQEYLARKNEQYSLKGLDLKAIAKRFHFKEVFGRNGKSLVEQAADMLDLLGVGSFADYRMSLPHAMEFMQDSGEDEAMVVWIKLCEQAVDIQNRSLADTPFSPSALRDSLERLKKISLNPNVTDSIKACRKRLNRCGVYLVVVPAVGNAKIRGLLTSYKDHPAIFLSLRFKTHDHVWFTLIHEIAHLLIHYGSEVCDDLLAEAELCSTPAKDAEANEFARNFFVDPVRYEMFLSRNVFTARDICEFAQGEEVDPGVIVGFLQHDGKLGFDAMNNLKSWCDK